MELQRSQGRRCLPSLVRYKRLRDVVKAVINISVYLGMVASATSITFSARWPIFTMDHRAAEQEGAKTSSTGRTSRTIKTSASLHTSNSQLFAGHLPAAAPPPPRPPGPSPASVAPLSCRVEAASQTAVCHTGPITSATPSRL